jgi:hypothetical protein
MMTMKILTARGAVPQTAATRRAAQPGLLIFTSSRRKMKLSNLSFSSHHAAN